MRYLKFRIRNFKGIKDTSVDLRTSTGANVFALVGLNESGKTTILEAIHSFSPDFRTRTLRRDQSKDDAEAAKERLPRHLLARFSGEITVEATASISPEEKLEVARSLKDDYEIKIDPNGIPDTFALTRSDVFERGDYIKTSKSFDFDLVGRKKGERKDKPLSGADADAAYFEL